MDSQNLRSLPSLFIGHGSPMNILDDNIYTQTMQQIGLTYPKPTAILCISAHWVTRGAEVLRAAWPRQIFDFHGFPEPLYQVRYTPPGAPAIADQMVLRNQSLKASETWGLDHGTWAILKFMYPQADIPVFQLSLNANLTPVEHLKSAQELRHLAEKGVLIIGSGNLVHNLQSIDWNPQAPPHEWALEFEDQALAILKDGNLDSSEKVRRVFSLSLLRTAHPTVEHLLPLIYAVSNAESNHSAEILIKGIQNAAISMAMAKF